MPAKIEDYALIGDCETAVLVTRDGSINWFCFPRFDSPACFAALLGTEDHGRWRIRPAGPIRKLRRRYRDGTLILEIDLVTDEGEVQLIDCMPPRTEAADVVRLVQGKRGKVSMRMELSIRFDYGAVVPWVRHAQKGIWAIAGPDALYLRTDVETHGENFQTVAEFTVSEGEEVPFTLSWYPSHKPEPPEQDAAKSVAETAAWWRAWSDRCTYDGGWRDAVLRSFITLKALTYAPTRGIFVQYYGCKQLGASLLMMPLVGFLPATGPRMRGTVEAVEQRLVRDGFVDRYPTLLEVDGLPPSEGAFLVYTFWLADNLALQRRYREARNLFERLLGLCNDVGLLSEEYDPETGRLVGNFP